MRNRGKTFWRSGRFFWKSSILTALVIIGVFCVILGVESVQVFKEKENNFFYRDFLFRAASGQNVEEKIAWPNYIEAVRSGRYIFEQNKSGKNLDQVLKEIGSLRAEFNDEKNKHILEDYIRYLRENYKTPWPLIMMAKEPRWDSIEKSESDIGALKGILYGKEYKAQPPEWEWDISTRIIIIILLATQFIAYLMGIAIYTENYGYHDGHKIAESRITLGGIITFLIFSPGALLIIVIQLYMIGKEQIPEYLAKKEARKDLISKAVEVDTTEQRELLRKLRERVEDQH